MDLFGFSDLPLLCFLSMWALGGGSGMSKIEGLEVAS